MTIVALSHNVVSTATEVRTPTVVIGAEKGLFDFELRSVWEYRELLYFLVWRNVKVRYKQTAIGITWVIVQPLLTMAILSVIFGYFGRIPSDGLPYALFTYTALLPWTYFAQALSRGGGGLVSEAGLITKILFPPSAHPLASILTPLVDFAFTFLILIGMMGWYRIAPTWGALAVPLFLLLAVTTALAVSLFLSALNVKYRDVGNLIPFVTQFWMYASPVIYPSSLITDRWRLVYSLNPMVGVIEGFRWALLGKEAPNSVALGVSTAAVAFMLVGGLVYFRRTERIFADEI